jgi:hypothetical protein
LSGRGAANPLEGIFRMLSAADEKVRGLGVKALADLSPGRLGELLRDPGLSAEARSFLFPGGHPALDGSEEKGTGAGSGSEEGRSADEPDGGDAEDLNTYQRVMRMNVGEKIKTAFKGDKEARSLLIRDANREVYMSVLENPGLTETEVEMIAKNSGSNQDILRKIARNKDWMANRAIVKGLVTNPKTPIEVSNRFLPRLTDKELDLLEGSRNLPSVLRLNARRLVVARKKKGG